MARTHTWLRCPHCNELLDRTSWSGGHAPKQYGIPIEKCRFCGRGFVRSDVSELATKPLEYYKRRLRLKRIALATTLLGGWGGIAGALYLYQFSGKAALVAMGISIVLSFAGYLVYSCNDDGLAAAKLESEYSESENRLKANPAYAKLIEELERQREGI